MDEIAELVNSAGGRTLGLFSSMRAAREAADAIRDRTDHPVLCQGEDMIGTLVRVLALWAECRERAPEARPEGAVAGVARAATTDDAMKKVYDEASKQITGEQEVRARHILVETEDEAKAIKAELEAIAAERPCCWPSACWSTAPSSWSNTPTGRWPRGWTRCSPMPVSNGGWRGVPCAWG